MVILKLIIVEEIISLSIFLDIFWSFFKDMWMKIVNECLYNGDEDGIIIVGERGVWKIWLYFFDN